MAFVLLFSGTMTITLMTVALRLRRSLARFAVSGTFPELTDAPTVSVCIPARNETHAMTQCLERVLASDYRKMEVIVFDDSSADDTSILIRSFAHAGVRFVPGNELPEGWLGKNHALEVLAREASGEYVVFMDVDTQIASHTISRLMEIVEAQGAEMASVIPGRGDGCRVSVLFGHLRYFWELVLSRRTAPGASSALWLMKRKTLLEKFGGFASLKDDVSPEITFAHELYGTYRGLLAGKKLGVTYEKKWRSQVETSRRLSYPRAGGKWWNGGLALVVLAILNFPSLVLTSGIIFGWGVSQVAALWFLLAFAAVYMVFTHRLWSHGWWLGGLLWPLIILQEFCLMAYSIVGYARHTVTWKGRLVTAHPDNVDALVIGR